MTGPRAGVVAARRRLRLISRSSLAEAMAEPCSVLTRSGAGAMEVESPRAMSCVDVLAADRHGLHVDEAPPELNTAAEVEPPPMSMQTAPRSISSSSSAASAETNGAATTPSNCRWARSDVQASSVFGTDGLRYRDDQELDAQRAAEHGARVAHAALPVDAPGDRQ